jgi:hypothetical protein
MRLGSASQRDPAESAEITIAIEEAGLCDGSVCGTAAPGQDGGIRIVSRAFAHDRKRKIARSRTVLLRDLAINRSLMVCR